LRRRKLGVWDRIFATDLAAFHAKRAWTNVKPMPGRLRSPAFSPSLYRYRNLVERLFNKITQHGPAAVQLEIDDANDLVLFQLAIARIWTRFMSR